MKPVYEQISNCRKSLIAAAIITGLSACGGGGGGDSGASASGGSTTGGNTAGTSGTSTGTPAPTGTGGSASPDGGGGDTTGSGSGISGGAAGTPAAGGQQLACIAYISTGFSGDLNAEYADGWGGVPQTNLVECSAPNGIGWYRFGGGGGGDGGGSGGSGGGGDGGAGGGAGEGKVLGGLMTVTRLSDGKVLGSAITDDKQGLVTIRPRAADGPVLLTLQGRAGARYYDESRKDYLPFEEGRVLHALVDSFEENVGVTAFTEAAYRYAINHFAADPARIAMGQASQLTNADNLRLSAAQVRAANNAVREAINNALPKTYQLPSVKALPTPVDASSPSTTALLNRYGISAAVTGGLAIASGLYAFNPQRPALEITEELASDLTDGVINGFSLNGRRVDAGTASGGGATQPHYDANQFPVLVNVGANIQARTISSTQIYAAVNGSVAVGRTAGYEFPGVPIPHAVGCVYFRDNFVLSKAGTIDLQRRRRTACNGPNDPIENVPVVAVKGFLGGADPVVLASSSWDAAFASTASGELKVWGSGGCGVLGTGQDSVTMAEPATVVGVRNVTSIAQTYFTTVVRDKTGHVFSWGSDQNGALGLGAGPKPDTCSLRPMVSASFAPRQVPGLENIVSVVPSNRGVESHTFFAVRADGKVFGWGDGSNGLLPNPSGSSVVSETPTANDVFAPVEIPGIDKVQTLVVDTSGSVLAVRSDGTVWGWGSNSSGIFGGNRTLVPVGSPVLVPGIPGPVRELLGSPAIALLTDGRVIRWGGATGGAAAVITGLPRIRHLFQGVNPNNEEVVYALSAEDERVFQIGGAAAVQDVTANFR